MVKEPTLFDDWEKRWEHVNRLADRLDGADTDAKINAIIRTIHGHPELQYLVKTWWKNDTAELEDGVVRPSERLSEYLRHHTIRVATLLREVPYLDQPSAMRAMNVVDGRERIARTLEVEVVDKPVIIPAAFPTPPSHGLPALRTDAAR